MNKKIRRSFSFLFFRQQTLYFRHRNSRLQNLSNPIISFLHLFYKTLFHIRRRFIQNDLIRLFLRNSFFFFFSFLSFSHSQTFLIAPLARGGRQHSLGENRKLFSVSKWRRVARRLLYAWKFAAYRREREREKKK